MNRAYTHEPTARRKQKMKRQHAPELTREHQLTRKQRGLGNRHVVLNGLGVEVDCVSDGCLEYEVGQLVYVKHSSCLLVVIDTGEDEVALLVDSRESKIGAQKTR